MAECNECGKKLALFEGYRHPTLGKDHTVCGRCFDQIQESVKQWQEFISPYMDFFENQSTKNQINNEIISKGFFNLKKMFGNIAIKKATVEN